MRKFLIEATHKAASIQWLIRQIFNSFVHFEFIYIISAWIFWHWDGSISAPYIVRQVSLCFIKALKVFTRPRPFHEKFHHSIVVFSHMYVIYFKWQSLTLSTLISAIDVCFLLLVFWLIEFFPKLVQFIAPAAVATVFFFLTFSFFLSNTVDYYKLPSQWERIW